MDCEKMHNNRMINIKKYTAQFTLTLHDLVVKTCLGTT